MIERSHLQILREVDQQGSLTSAAKQLHLTQSALSHAIKKLEHQAGTPLWQKDGRELRLTQAGQYLLQFANRILPQFEQADSVLQKIALGEKGTLKIGMECHPCYRWLLKAVAPFLQQWPGIDVDVKQKFQFGGMAALFSHEIDVLVTPDPLNKKGVEFTQVFDYELVLVVAKEHHLSQKRNVHPQDLTEETLLTYPVEKERLDIYTQFLLPQNCSPRKHKPVEATDIMLQLVAANRGVAVLPLWLVEEYTSTLPIHALRLGNTGIQKSICLGTRERDTAIPYIDAFKSLAKSHSMNET